MAAAAKDDNDLWKHIAGRPWSGTALSAQPYRRVQ
jgi:hypothetical protein